MTMKCDMVQMVASRTCNRLHQSAFAKSASPHLGDVKLQTGQGILLLRHLGSIIGV